MLLSVQFENFHRMDASFLETESECGAHDMKTLYACGTWIYHQHIPLGVTHNLQYMGMTANKDVRTVLVNQLSCLGIVTSGISSYMCHQNLQALALKETVHRVDISKIEIVTVSCNSDQRLESCNLLCCSHPSSEVSGMPYLIDRFKELPELSVKDTMRIRNQSYVFHG